jgi:hypothetical protein
MLATSFKNMLAPAPPGRHRRGGHPGVALISGTLVLTDTISQTFSGLYTTIYKGDRRGRQGQGGLRRDPGQRRATAPRRCRPGRLAAHGQRRGRRRGRGPRLRAPGRQQWPGAGQPEHHRDHRRSWPATGQLNPWTLAAGRPPRAGNEIVIDHKSASDGHLAVGDTATVLVRTAPADADHRDSGLRHCLQPGRRLRGRPVTQDPAPILVTGQVGPGGQGGGVAGAEQPLAARRRPADLW